MLTFSARTIGAHKVRSRKVRSQKAGNITLALDQTIPSTQLVPIHHILLHSEWLAEDVIRELSLGAHFSEMAIEYSACPSAHNKGFTGYHDVTQLPEPLRIALQMDDGQHPVIGPIKTHLGFHILKSLDLRQTRLSTSSETSGVQSKISELSDATASPEADASEDAVTPLDNVQRDET